MKAGKGGLRALIKRLGIPVTLIIVPHTNKTPIKVKLPTILLFFIIFVTLGGAFGILMKSVKTVEYNMMKKKVERISSEFGELRFTIASIKKAEQELERLISFKRKEKVFEEIKDPTPGSLDFESLKKEIEETIESVTEIKRFLKEQKDIFMATPRGLPVEGKITSKFGKRVHPITGEWSFHTGVDIEAPPGTPIKATADGIVSFSSWNYESGYMIVIEHGCGFSTVYAHNRKNYVRVGNRVKRAEIIGISGDSGSTTAPHLHYEVWKEKRPVDPEKYIKGSCVEKR